MSVVRINKILAILSTIIITITTIIRIMTIKFIKRMKLTIIKKICWEIVQRRKQHSSNNQTQINITS